MAHSLQFGKHKGRRLDAVPKAYVRFLCSWDDDPREAATYLQARQRGTVKAARLYAREKRWCRACFRYMPPIGTSRANGAAWHDDWETREYHKTCWRAMKEEEGEETDMEDEEREGEDERPRPGESAEDFCRRKANEI